MEESVFDAPGEEVCTGLRRGVRGSERERQGEGGRRKVGMGGVRSERLRGAKEEAQAQGQTQEAEEKQEAFKNVKMMTNLS